MEKQALRRAREAFLSGRTRPIEFRLQQLHELQRMISEKEGEICAALKQDINRVSGSSAWGFLRAVALNQGFFVCCCFYFLLENV